jgi:uncharacterized membrane protein YedE/YeeE
MTFEIPWLALLGGALIGVSASFLLVFSGRIAGISGILDGALTTREATEGGAWRLWFLGGLVLGSALLRLLRPEAFGASSMPMGLLLVAGLLVGFGTRLGNGCTSGHGVCGVSRLSARSLVATATFVGVAMLTTFVLRHLLGVGGAP